MKLKLGVISLVLFLLSVLFLILMTVFESTLTDFSLTGERILGLVLLVVPAVIGVVCGLLSIARKESRIWVGILGILLNGLFALFHLFVLSFAG
jgi:hypothetical protein